MPPTATKIENAGPQRPQLWREDGAYRGVVYYLVRSAPGFADAHAADGLPADGDPFDAEHPDVRAYRFTPEMEEGRHGAWFMRVDYRQDGSGPYGGVTPADGVRVTTLLEQSRTTETVDTDVTFSSRLTHDGSGVPKIVNAMTLRVTSFSTAVPDIAPLVELSDSPKVNDQQLQLPRFLGGPDPLIIDAGQLLYAGFKPYKQGAFYVVEHELLLRRTWKHEKYPVDANGEPSGGLIEELDVYEEADFVAVIGG